MHFFYNFVFGAEILELVASAAVSWPKCGVSRPLQYGPAGLPFSRLRTVQQHIARKRECPVEEATRNVIVVRWTPWAAVSCRHFQLASSGCAHAPGKRQIVDADGLAKKAHRQMFRGSVPYHRVLRTWRSGGKLITIAGMRIIGHGQSL